MIKIKKDIAATPKSAESIDDAKFTFASAKNSDNDHSQFLNSKNLNQASRSAVIIYLTKNTSYGKLSAAEKRKLSTDSKKVGSKSIASTNLFSLTPLLLSDKLLGS